MCLCVCVHVNFVCSIDASASVTNLTVRGVQPTAVELSWGPVNDRDQNGVIILFGIYYRLYNSSDNYRMVNVTARVSHDA